MKKIQIDLIDEGIEDIISGVDLLFKLGNEEEKEHYFESIADVLVK